ncbi:MAG: type II toxin-antitoxin system HicA family toxin [Bacteroides sp.]|nr:type II toxin-antitoxin system HicA family toxin [Bacteroides sp.]
MQTLLEILGFQLSNKGKTSGSRIKFYNNMTTIILHKPHPRKELLEYQIKQIIEKLKEDGLI